MEISVKTYEYQKIEKSDTKFQLPEETTYWFETGIRRAIRIVPIWTTWQLENDNKPEEIWKYHFTCVYRSFENKIESFSISLHDFPNYYLQEKRNIVKEFMDYDFDERTKEQFENDLESALTSLNEYR